MKTNQNNNALDKAIDKSRTKQTSGSTSQAATLVDEQQSDPNETALAVFHEEGMAVEAFDPQKLVDLARSGQFETAERILELQEGMMIRGQLIGRGPDAEVEDTTTRLPKKVGTWRMRLSSGARVSFLTSAQLDRMLPEFIGRKGETVIARGGQVRTKRNRVMSEFYVLGPPASAPKLAEHAGVVEIVETKAGE